MLALALALAAAQAGAAPVPPAELQQSSGPHGTSGNARYDEVGLAGPGPEQGFTATSEALPAGSFAEVTSLANGKTVLVAIAGPGAPHGHAIGLSPRTLAALAMAGGGPVRVRRVTPTAQDIAALRSGQQAVGRADAPAVLLTALRHKIAPAAESVAMPAPVKTAAARPAVTPPPPKLATRATPKPTASPMPKPAPRPAHGAGYYVQVAALSNRANANALATKLGGSAVASGKLWRVRLGPFATSAEAQRGRDGAAHRGYGDAKIVRED